MGAQHTPGPWAVRQFGARGEWDVRGPWGEDLANVNATDGADEPQVYPAEANARLMAAAPDLLASLKALEHLLAGESDALRKRFADARAHARRAIARAEGRT